jgi:hypothetical protein
MVAPVEWQGAREQTVGETVTRGAPEVREEREAARRIRSTPFTGGWEPQQKGGPRSHPYI